MPVPALVGGIPLAYVALIGGSSFASIMSIHSPALYRISHGAYYNWKYYWRRFAFAQNQEACLLILRWLFAHQHQIKGSGINTVFSAHGLKFNFRLPKLNKNCPIRTKFGKIYIRLLSMDNMTIGGIEVAVKKRPWIMVRQSRVNFLDCFLRDQFAQSQILMEDAINNLVMPPEIDKNPITNPKLPEAMMALLNAHSSGNPAQNPSHHNIKTPPYMPPQPPTKIINKTKKKTKEDTDNMTEPLLPNIKSSVNTKTPP